MSERIVAMMHVPDVSATANWYASIGFELRNTASDGAEVVWALLAYGDSELMLNVGGKPSAEHRREVDLYIHVSDVEALSSRLQGLAEVVEDVHDTFYGRKEFIIRDCNRFWITFGQPST